MLGEIIGPDILIVLVVLVVLFGGTQLPKLARSVGQAKHELDRGLKEGAAKKEAAAAASADEGRTDA